MGTMISVRFSFVGFHRWPAAPSSHEYLASRHRHRFEVEARVEVFEDDREIEFHDFLDFCRSGLAEGDWGSASCEMMAAGLARTIVAEYPGRDVSVAVFEDGEVGAICTG